VWRNKLLFRPNGNLPRSPGDLDPDAHFGKKPGHRTPLTSPKGPARPGPTDVQTLRSPPTVVGKKLPESSKAFAGQGRGRMGHGRGGGEHFFARLTGFGAVPRKTHRPEVPALRESNDRAVGPTKRHGVLGINRVHGTWGGRAVKFTGGQGAGTFPGHSPRGPSVVYQRKRVASASLLGVPHPNGWVWGHPGSGVFGSTPNGHPHQLSFGAHFLGLPQGPPQGNLGGFEGWGGFWPPGVESSPHFSKEDDGSGRK